MPDWFPQLVQYPNEPEIAADLWEEYCHDMDDIRRKEEAAANG